MHFSLSLRLCYTAIRPFCDRAAASSKEVKYFVWFSIFEVWQESYLWQTGSWDQARRLQQLPPKHGELLHRPSSPLSWMQELCQLPISMHCRQKPAAPRSTLSVGLDEAHNSIKVAIMWSFNLKIVILMILVMDQKKNRNYPLGKAFNPHLRIGLENLTSCQDEIISQQRYSVAFILQPHPLVGRCLELSTLTRFSICWCL